MVHGRVAKIKTWMCTFSYGSSS